jgi:hypothetical protein
MNRNFESTIDIPSGITAKQSAVLEKWNGKEYDMAREESEAELRKFAEELNEANMLPFHMEYRITDEYGGAEGVDFNWDTAQWEYYSY